jgi:hypothetical protein
MDEVEELTDADWRTLCDTLRGSIAMFDMLLAECTTAARRRAWWRRRASGARRSSKNRETPTVLSAVGVRLIVWCGECGPQGRPAPLDLARRHGRTTVLV